MKRLVTLIATMFFALAASATTTTLYEKYESVREALLKESVSEVQQTSKALAEAARTEKQTSIAERAEALSNAANLKGARDSFAMLSEQMIRFRDSQSGDRPAVLYCAMHKVSWLQPKGATANPYVDASMRSCGEIRKDQAATAPPSQEHHH